MVGEGGACLKKVSHAQADAVSQADEVVVSHCSGEDHQLISKNGSTAATQKVLPSQWSETTDGVTCGTCRAQNRNGQRERENKIIVRYLSVPERPTSFITTVRSSYAN